MLQYEMLGLKLTCYRDKWQFPKVAALPDSFASITVYRPWLDTKPPVKSVNIVLYAFLFEIHCAIEVPH